jgi:peptide/nickel transport system substrate-binding protein
MPSRFRRPIVAIATVLVTFALAPGAASAQGADPKHTLNVALFSEPDFIDPHVATSVGFVPIDNAYESLVMTERNSTKLVPQLAESWTVSPDGRTFTFKLRRGVKFHDGADLDAAAVVASYDRLRKLNKGPAWVLAHVESVEARDPGTVQIKIVPGGPPFPEAFSLIRIVSPKTLREKEAGGDLAQDFLNRQSAGTGPYRIVSWQRSQRVTLRKFDAYWGGWKPNYFTVVNMLIIPEASTQRLMLDKGELDMAMKFPAEALPSFAANRDLQIVREPGLRVLYLRLQNAAPPTSDVRVRQAINYAFDVQSFMKAMEGTYDPPVGPAPGLFLGKWTPKYPYRYDVAKAKALLAEAGYTETRKAKLVADVLIATPDQRKAAEILQAGLAATRAAELDIRENEWPVMLKYAIEWQKSKDPAAAHHLFGLFTPPRVPDAYAYLWYTYNSKAIGAFARNIMNYTNPKVDELLDRAAAHTDPVQKIALYRQATQIIVDDAADLFVGTQTKVYALRRGLKGFFAHPTWYPTVYAYGMTRE